MFYLDVPIIDKNTGVEPALTVIFVHVFMIRDQ